MKEAKKSAEKKTEAKKEDVIDLIFKSLDVKGIGSIKKNDLLEALYFRGILEDDLRIRGVVEALNSSKDEGISPSRFRTIVSPHITLIEKALTGNLIIPDFVNFCSFITNLYNRTIQNKNGVVSDSIPELGKVDPDLYAISICTIDGQRFNLGNYQTPYLADATHKPLTCCMAPP